MKNGLRKALDQLRQSLSPTGISDAQLLNSFLAERDEAAFAALVRRHGPMVLAVCTRVLRNSHDSEDAFQATFLALVQKARFVVNRQALAPWLYTVAYRSALEVQIRNTRRRNRERRVAMWHAETTPPEAQDWRPVLDRELNRLPEKYRVPIILCDIEGLSRREAARQLHLAEGTLSSRLATARRMLAQRLSRHGATLSGGALAVSLSEAWASVPPSLVGLTTKSVLLVAAGQTAAVSASISLIVKGAAQAMFLAKLKPALATVMALTLGAGTLVYWASGQTGAVGKPTAAAKASNELEALRHENETLKATLRGFVPAALFRTQDEDEAAKLTLGLQLAEGAKERIKKLETRIKELESEVAALRKFLAEQLNPLPDQPKPANKEQAKPMEPESIEALMKRLGTLPARLAKSKKNDAELVEALFAAALKRMPSEPERAKVENHFQGAKDRIETCRDFLWALVNSREFLKQHGLDQDVAGSLQLLNRLSAGWDQQREAEKQAKAVRPMTLRIQGLVEAVDPNLGTITIRDETPTHTFLKHARVDGETKELILERAAKGSRAARYVDLLVAKDARLTDDKKGLKLQDLTGGMQVELDLGAGPLGLVVLSLRRIENPVRALP